MDRRDFLKAGGLLLAGTSSVFGVRLLTVPTAGATVAGETSTQRRWGMVINLEKCREDCTACLDACRAENNVALYGDERWDIHWIRKVKIKAKDAADETARAVPVLCNHCDQPPCAQVCPVQATYKRADGIVIIDHHRCIGCRYCMIACPYNARFFNFRENSEWPNKNYPKRSHGVAESCNLCAHLLDQGELPACVQACQKVNAGALTVGDLNDPASEVSRLIADHPTRRLRESLGTEPKIYYLGL